MLVSYNIWTISPRNSQMIVEKEDLTLVENIYEKANTSQSAFHISETVNQNTKEVEAVSIQLATSPDEWRFT